MIPGPTFHDSPATLTPPANPTAAELVQLTGLDHAAAVRVVEQVAAERSAAVADGEPACRECGCTQNAACFGGCSWIEPDLCSRCA